LSWLASRQPCFEDGFLIRALEVAGWRLLRVETEEDWSVPDESEGDLQ